MLESLSNNMFTYKKLTEEEQQTRGILGRLVGVIADTVNPTRNGRKYGKDLWENVFNDPIMEEKIANRCCFGELGHPANREEIDPEKIAICLAEKPKLGKDGKLYGVFDILNTPNGKILKTLCDYGTNIGVSSRGSGDIMSNDEVDPDTYYCECWDAVVVPAVKSARPQYVTESLDTNKLKLRTALTEAYDAASEEDKKIMKESLENLNININEDTINVEDIPWAEEDPEENKILAEVADPENIDSEESGVEETEKVISIEEIPDAEEESGFEIEEIEMSEEPKTVPVETATNAVRDVAETIKDAVNADSETEETINDIADEKIEEINSTAEKEATPEESGEVIKDEQTEVEETPVEDIEAESIEESGFEEEENSNEAEDAGLNEWISNLKEMIRRNDLLEAEIKNLKDEKAVSDAEVKDLKEELEKYKTGFARVSDLAAKSTMFKKEVQNLSEQLTQKESELKTLRQKREDTTKLTESVNAHATKVKFLTEKLDAMQKDLTDTETKLNEQKIQSKNKLTEAINIAKTYKANYESVMKHYIESKASMLGVRTTDITGRLNENYTIKDVDAVCEELLEAPQHFSNSLFSEIKKGASIKINESVEKNKTDSGYEIDDDLLELAGLK